VQTATKLANLSPDKKNMLNRNFTELTAAEHQTITSRSQN